MPRKSNSYPDNDLSIIEEINQNINNYMDYSKDNVSRGQDDKRFLYVSQWTSSQEQELDRLQKPNMTFNKTYDIIRKVIAEQRNHKTQFRVSSMLGLSSEEELNVFKGAIMKIARDSDTSSVFDRAYDDAASSGFGAWRVYTDYEHAESFNQIPKVSWIPDPEKCFWDTNATDPTMCDSEFCGYYKMMDLKKFEKLHPDIKSPQSFNTFFRDSTFKWINKNTIAIVEYYKKEWFTTEKYQLRNGMVLFKEEYKKLMASINKSSTEEIMDYEIIKAEKDEDFNIVYYKAIKGKVLEKKPWLIKRLPLVRVVCDSQRINGREHILSLVSFVKDAQTFHNLVKIEIAQAIKYNRREQWLAHPSSVSSFKEQWKNPSIQQGVLLADYDERGNLPIKIGPSEISTTLIDQARASELDIQSILGMYESNRGAMGNELSGRAIRERRETGLLGACVLNDNFNKAVEQTGKIIGDLLQKVIDTERRLPVMIDEGRYRDVLVNKKLLDGKREMDFSKDRYDVTIDPGPSFAIQKADSLDVLTQLVTIQPQIFPMVADIFGENIDINGSAKLKERLRELVPAEIRAKEEGKQLPPPPPDPMQSIVQAQVENQSRELDIREQKNTQEASLREQKQMMEFIIQQQKAQLEAIRMEREQYMEAMRVAVEEMKAQASIAAASAKALQAKVSSEKVMAQVI